MAKIIKLTNEAAPRKYGLQRARSRKKVDLEDFGQLNMFTVPPSEAKVVRFTSRLNPFEEALQLDDQGDKQTREFYWKAIHAGDCVADAYCNLGILESEGNETVKAIDCFTNALKHDPRHFESHYNLANIYSEAGDFSLAILHYQIAREIEPGFPNVYYNLGLAHAMARDYRAAAEVLIKYKELAPEEEGRNADGLLLSLRKSLSNLK